MDFDDKKGISLLMINTDKADRIFSKISKKMEYREVDIEKAFMYNHNCNVPQSKHREKFFEGISNGFINENNIIKIMEKYRHLQAKNLLSSMDLHTLSYQYPVLSIHPHQM